MPRKYDLGKRRDLVEETRQRIVDAALALHTSRGPASTSVRDIAARADVSLVTVYRHFPAADEIYRACRARFFEKYPPPRFEVKPKDAREERVRALLRQLYGYYDAVGDLMWPVLRDSELVPEVGAGFREMEKSFTEIAEQAVLAGGRPTPDLQRVVDLVVLFMSLATWRTLVRVRGRTSLETAELAVMSSKSSPAGRTEA